MLTVSSCDIAEYIPHEVHNAALVFRIWKDFSDGLYQAETFISDHNPGTGQATCFQ